MDSEKIAVVLGYGVPAEIMEDGNYRRYLRSVLRYVTQHGIKRFILCGGSTNARFPEKTEAEEMQRFIKRMVAPGNGFRYELEKNSLTTWENVFGAVRFICKIDDSQPLDIFVFCEKTREAKVRLLARRIFHVFHQSCVVRVIGIDFDATRTLLKDAKQIVGFLLAALECQFSLIDINEWHRRRRLAKIQRDKQK